MLSCKDNYSQVGKGIPVLHCLLRKLWEGGKGYWKSNLGIIMALLRQCNAVAWGYETQQEEESKRWMEQLWEETQ